MAQAKFWCITRRARRAVTIAPGTQRRSSFHSSASEERRVRSLPPPMAIEVSAARATGEIFWYEQNDDGSWTEHVAFDSTGQMIDVGSGDVDGDGQTDIVAANQSADIVYWLENDIIA